MSAEHGSDGPMSLQAMLLAGWLGGVPALWWMLAVSGRRLGWSSRTQLVVGSLCAGGTALGFLASVMVHRLAPEAAWFPLLDRGATRVVMLLGWGLAAVWLRRVPPYAEAALPSRFGSPWGHGLLGVLGWGTLAVVLHVWLLGLLGLAR